LIQLDTATVIAIHNKVINPKELQGLAADKSLESCLMRVDNRLMYGMIEDVYSLAANYAKCIATGHCFNDANERTAANAMDVCLVLNGVELDFVAEILGNKITAIACNELDEDHLARWLKAPHKLRDDESL